jgi:hypothetical protein
MGLGFGIFIKEWGVVSKEDGKWNHRGKPINTVCYPLSLSSSAKIVDELKLTLGEPPSDLEVGYYDEKNRWHGCLFSSLTRA